MSKKSSVMLFFMLAFLLMVGSRLASDFCFVNATLGTPIYIEADETADPPGPNIDELLFKVIKSPDARLIAMQTGEADVSTDLIRTGDIEDLDGRGFTITVRPGFHMSHIGINIRPDQSYRPGHPLENQLKGAVLSDVWFRKALFHLYDQKTIVSSIYKYIVTPVRSLVPPEQRCWYNPEVPNVPYNPGDKYAITEWPEDDSACGALRYANYTYDSIEDNWRTPEGWGIELGGQLLPELKCFTPTYEVAPTEAEHGARWVADCGAIGLPLLHEPYEFGPYLEKVFHLADFDMYMMFWNLDMFPDHLYDMCHSSQDCVWYPWGYNAPGIVDPELDLLLEIVKFSLDREAKIDAALEVQSRLYDYSHPECAFAYMNLYSRVYFNAYAPGLMGIVDSHGFGSDNMWTFLNMHGASTVVWCLHDEPERLNPCYARTNHAWEVLDRIHDPLIALNPYTHEDVPWLATDWEIQKWATEDEVAGLLGGAVLDSHWHEAWPQWSTDWDLTSWNDTDTSSTLTVNDEVDFEDDLDTYLVTDVAWDIKIENKSDPYNEMKLHAIGGPVPPAPVTDPTIVPVWHELWPNYCTSWTVMSWVDSDASGDLTRSDQIQLHDGTWCHVDSVTVTIELDKKPVNALTDKYLEFVGEGMKILFWLRDDVEWQDGNLYTAQDAKFNWLFLRDNQIPRYTSTWEHLVDAVTVGPDGQDHFKVVAYLDVTSQLLLYDLAKTAALLPPPVWNWLDGYPQEQIFAYDPGNNATTPLDPEYPAGPRFGTADCPTQLYGTGAFTFQYYDTFAMVIDMLANRYYFKTTQEIQDQLVEMFHRCGDVNRDGRVWSEDKFAWGEAYGYVQGEPEYNPDADLDEDGVVYVLDGAYIGLYLGEWREYPPPSFGGSASSSSSYVNEESIFHKSQAGYTSSSTGTTLYVDPPSILDETLQAGASFPVNMSVSDVSNLRAWQVRMSWNASIFNVTQITEGNFLETAPAAWKGRPYAHETEPYFEETKSASTSTPGAIAGWTFPSGAYFDDSLYANCNTPDAEEIYGGYGFSTGSITTVSKLEVGVKLKTPESNTTELDKLEVQVSNDGGTTWGQNHTVPAYTYERLQWVGVTNDFPWTPSMLTDINFRVKVRYKQTGENAATILLNWIPARVVDTLSVDNPYRAFDTNQDTHASFRYSERDGSFAVFDFGHNFPSGVFKGIDEKSIITQVDLHIRYETGASAAGDQYRITYNTDFFSPQTLVAWSSSATPLDTYNFTDIQDYDPFFPGWEWIDLERLRVTVDVDRVGGDPNAFFREYEAWIVVTYKRPTVFVYRINQDEGWCIFAGITEGGYLGVTGSGWLATLEFEVLDYYGCTILNITHPPTQLLELRCHPLVPQQIPLTPENGYFRNLYPGDIDGDKYVGSADAGILNGAYGTWRGDPLYVRESDFDDDTYIGSADAGVLNGAYGTTYP